MNSKTEYRTERKIEEEVSDQCEFEYNKSYKDLPIKSNVFKIRRFSDMENSSPSAGDIHPKDAAAKLAELASFQRKDSKEESPECSEKIDEKSCEFEYDESYKDLPIKSNVFKIRRFSDMESSSPSAGDIHPKDAAAKLAELASLQRKDSKEKDTEKTPEYSEKADVITETADIDPSEQMMRRIEKILEQRYELIKPLGRGAQGEVFLGKHSESGDSVAIKAMNLGSIDNWKQYDLFHRESSVLSSLDVDGVAHFYESVEDLDSDHPISMIIQEYIDGKSLQAYLDEGKRFRLTEVCEIMVQMVDILDHLHHHEPAVIHRDVKPSNIILHYDSGKYSVIPKVYLIDFGAVANPQLKDGGSTVTGTYGYMAPEQLIGKPQPASDLYSLAVLAVYLLSGTSPENIEVKELRLIIDPYLESYPHVMTVLLRQMLETNPNKRLCDYSIIRNAFEKFSKQEFNIELFEKEQKKKRCGSKTVKTLEQAGNIEIWESLPDNTPRKIPHGYGRMIIQDALHDLFLPLKKSIGYGTPFELYKNDKSAVIILIIISVFLIILLANLSAEYAVICFSAIICLSAAVTSVCIYRAYAKTGRLLKYGRKTLATIESIDCGIKCDSIDMSEVNEDDYMNSINESLEDKKLMWHIIYTFNPPDDENPDSLRHDYYSFEPVSDLAVGDVLPILYEIGRDKKSGRETVTSVPFPMPDHDTFCLSNVYMGDMDEPASSIYRPQLSG